LSPPKLAKLVSIRAFAMSQGVALTTMYRRLARLEAEGPCPWIVRDHEHKSGKAIRINVELMRVHHPAMFEPACLEEEVADLSDQVEAVVEALRGHGTRLQILERRAR
jgi:DNA-binding transcriptional regulator YhcF (GntR family)